METRHSEAVVESHFPTQVFFCFLYNSSIFHVFSVHAQATVSETASLQPN